MPFCNKIYLKNCQNIPISAVFKRVNEILYYFALLDNTIYINCPHEVGKVLEVAETVAKFRTCGGC